MKLKKDTIYAPSTFTFRGWSPADADVTGYNCWDFFENGRYLGPDQYGVEPEFEADPLLSPVPEYEENGQW